MLLLLLGLVTYGLTSQRKWPVFKTQVEVPIKEILSIYLQYQTNYISKSLKSYHLTDCQFVVSFRVARLLHRDFLRYKGLKNFH